ncbi:hypothetical protein [Spelaeicoccus albus]|uniref:Uncharacterized protein n=1 Tax=Spelaeicoccus albus TaxID=1280376 RepID=A0A7Z0II64_9MICO|nr:hypothetical protein [Spelaeicoccus albus]NYI68210.1 hypothetical protein [Spelaeicoccus albus]
MSSITSKPARLHTGHAAGVRAIADVAERWVATLGVVLCSVQIGLAALGFWGANLHPGNEAADRAAFAPHAMMGSVLQWVSIALLILGLIALSNWKSWVLPLIAGVLLWLVQGPLVGLGFSVSIWFGFAHAVSGTVITAALVWLMVDRWKHR